MEKHMPGPWHTERNSASSHSVYPYRVRHKVNDDFTADIGEVWHKANASLIAAAPDLLAALKALYRNVDRDLSGYWTESTSNFMQQAEAAIRKAEG